MNSLKQNLKYRQLLAPVVQALVKPSEPLARGGEGIVWRQKLVSEHSLGAQETWEHGECLIPATCAGHLRPPSAHPELEMWEWNGTSGGAGG